ncbi:CRISPR-associated protein Cas5 [Hymenobacter rubripertinctus]|uniref:CRISPR-associated protein Cas5 n=1 Tax=Hymenobacter rubripertinctus TaxID=2029981 RepID=A0A418QIW6_9BACT|nr:CRISPR-associated protein Cas5 [Hymenobacter rubripertinctus]RIY05133.1 CRISPR-associated protein Cas5 [Hymenobacter rubripertinctus]
MQTLLSFDAPQPVPIEDLSGTPPAAPTLVSFDVRADFGFLRKPDVNDGLSLSYNLLHRPALLGLLGAVAGLGGYAGRGQRPEYWHKLGHLRVGVAPLAYAGAETATGSRPRHERGSFAKTVIEYTNTVGYANADGTWILRESTLIRPAYRCFVLLNRANPVEEILYQRLHRQEAEFLPYLGKNEFALSWDNVQKIPEARPFAGGRDFEVVSAFRKTERVSDAVARAVGLRAARQTSAAEPPFLHFERLPVGFDEHLMQYRYADFVFSNVRFQADAPIENLYEWQDSQVVQLH